MSITTSKRKTFEYVTVEKVDLSEPRNSITPHGDKEFVKAARSAIAECIEVERDFYIPNCDPNGECTPKAIKKWRLKVKKLRQLSRLDKQAFISMYLKTCGLRFISDIGESYFDQLEAEGEIKSRRTWPKGF